MTKTFVLNWRRVMNPEMLPSGPCRVGGRAAEREQNVTTPRNRDQSEALACRGSSRAYWIAVRILRLAVIRLDYEQ